jgi:GNAT superfamily N-acetyltransferase
MLESEIGLAPLVTTYLEMRSPEQLRPRCADAQFEVREKFDPDWQFNREMYFRVGEPWHWIDKRAWSDRQWKDDANSPELRTFAAYYDDELVGYYELRRESQPDGRNVAVEIAYFGLLPGFVGRGFGGALLTSAIENAWRTSPAPSRVWVHTCNRDHSQALANYQARGMVVYKIEEGRVI